MNSLLSAVHEAIDGMAAVPDSGELWVRVVQPIQLDDPWDLLGTEWLRNKNVVAWESPQGRSNPSSFLAVGRVIREALVGHRRFERADAIWKTVRERMVTVPDGVKTTGLPVLIGGFAFASLGSERSGRWAGWHDGMVGIPELLIHRTNGETVAAMTVQVTLGETFDTQLTDGLARIARLLGHLTAEAQIKNDLSRESKTGLGWRDSGGDRSAWDESVEQACVDLHDGKIEKVVMAREVRAVPDSGQRFQPLATAMALRKRQPSCVAFAFQRSNGDVFVGATPEPLVEVAGRQIRTVAVAGTTKRGGATGSDSALGHALLESGKDRREHALVVEAIQKGLEPLLTTDSIADGPKVVRHANVQHLETYIQGVLQEGVTLFRVAEHLHPTPAVGGVPRQLALEWVTEHEDMDRGWYAGPVGWIDVEGNGELVVAIRSALMGPERLSAFAGCGLVSGSEPKAEWEESNHKLRAVLDAVVQSDASADGPVDLDQKIRGAVS